MMRIACFSPYYDLLYAVRVSRSYHLQRLVEEGARYVVVSGTPSAGCMPMALAKYGVMAAANATKDREYDAQMGCLRRLNGLSRYHNWLLRESVRRMRVKYPAATLIYADFYKPVAQIVRRPAKFGESPPSKQ
jgi:phospholipase/lecithinase/hemolysin